MSARRACGSEAPSVAGCFTLGSRAPIASQSMPGRQSAWRRQVVVALVAEDLAIDLQIGAVVSLLPPERVLAERAVLRVEVFLPKRRRLDDMAVAVEYYELLGRHDRLPPAQPRRVASTAAGRFPTSSTASGASAPVCWLMRYEARRPDAVPTANRKCPAGSRQNALGTASVGMFPAAVRCPAAGSTAKAPILLLLAARLPTYRNRPEGVRWICEQVVRSL